MSAPLSVCPALSFVKIFYDILYMMIADHDIQGLREPNVFKKVKISSLKLGKMGQNQARNFFFHFLKFGSLVFLEIAYNESLQQCLTCSRGKIPDKKFGDLIFGKMGQNQAKIQGFFAIFSSLFHQFSFELHRMIACNNVQFLVEVKPAKKNWAKIGRKISFF